ncbi:dynamin family protein [Paenibacillus sp. MBLB4367]|uniref:dynamin family protein n=1 Tax=Paenibacillus sp. MBLB4367 TaxID=3384767 RepID=UPI0039083E6E
MNNQTLLDIAQLMRESGDGLHAEKLAEVERKYSSGELTIAFCGHFSAGKSSLVNRLCGHRLLPSSPIPTSANIVAIRNGAPAVKVTRTGGSAGERTAVIAPEELDAYCKNGEDIASIDISYPIPLLGDRLALLDTPGVDSTDDAHRMATESALHLADVVFYVMDYNHVLSEMNFEFAKKLKEWGKPIYLIVNQIDKHREQELTFEAFRQGVAEAFANWHISPDGFVYLSLKYPDHPHHEWEKLLWLIGSLQEKADELREWSAICSADQLIRDHAKVLETQNEAEKSKLAEIAADVKPLQDAHGAEAVDEEGGEGTEPETDGGDAASLTEALNLKRRELAALTEQADRKLADWKIELQKLLDNANITPAGTRDLAEHYLQARKPGFKVGFFAGAAKTAKETESRLAAFQADFSERVRANIAWHLQTWVKAALEETGLKGEAYSGAVDSIAFEVSPQWLANQVQPGASFTGEYTLNYAKQIAGEVKTQFRRLSLEVLERAHAELAEASRAEADALRAELAALERRCEAQQALERLRAQEAAYAEALRQRLREGGAAAKPAVPDGAALEAAAPSAPGERAAVPAPAEPQPAAASRGEAASAAQAKAPQAAAAGEGAAGAHAARLRDTAVQLRGAAELVGGIPALGSIARSMREKADRLAGNRFTIALFGAFSAGKSSFANALLGERVLPVSPNPTTAAINTIVPATPEHPHGTVRVKMKQEEAVLEEVRYSLRVLGHPSGGWDDALAKIEAIAPQQVNAGGKAHYTFLKAVAKGYGEAKESFGRELIAGFEQFASYVAEERKSCFVETIALHYANKLTDQGVVFVDTPGADSINARHTGVAFNYIKNADAILFVTYYNHAFSQADREFLLQLGRVKDSFEMDKMFFIVNAADLAEDSDELKQVVAHVEDNLLKHGIRNPRIYPVSSKLAVEGKMQADRKLVEESGIEPFEQDFIRFTFEELTGITVRAAKHEMKRASALLQEWMASARQGEAERKERLRALDDAFEAVQAELKAPLSASYVQDMGKETQELLYYVKQRAMYRFGDFYQMAFNPASLREDGGDIRKLLRSAWIELQRLLSYDFSQEVLATTLRVEQFMNRSAATMLSEKAAGVRERLPAFESEPFEKASFTTPEVEETLEIGEADEKWLHGFFKSGKHFFEGEGKQKLRASLESKLAEPIAAYLERHRSLIADMYGGQFERLLLERRGALLEAAAEHVSGIRDALEMKVDFDKLRHMQEQLEVLYGEEAAVKA